MNSPSASVFNYGEVTLNEAILCLSILEIRKLDIKEAIDKFLYHVTHKEIRYSIIILLVYDKTSVYDIYHRTMCDHTACNGVHDVLKNKNVYLYFYSKVFSILPSVLS